MKKKSVIAILVIVIVVLLFLIIKNTGIFDKAMNIKQEPPIEDIANKSIDTESSSTSGILEEDLIRTDEQGEVDVSISFNNIVEDNKDSLVFKVMLNTHSVDLEDIKYDELAALRTSSGLVIDRGFTWELGGGGGHHIYGYLKLSKEYDGSFIINEETQYIELELRNLAEIETRVFRWDKDILNAYNGGRAYD